MGVGGWITSNCLRYSPPPWETLGIKRLTAINIHLVANRWLLIRLWISPNRDNSVRIHFGVEEHQVYNHLVFVVSALQRRHLQTVRENRKAPNTKPIIEKCGWLQRKTGGMVKTLEMIGFTANKSVIRSQAPTVQCTMEKVQRLNGGGFWDIYLKA